MDCSWPFGNTGCNGGFQDKAFNFVLANGGIASNADYPYTGVNSACRNATRKAAALSSYVNVEAYQGDHLREALLTKGPMTVSLDADDPGFAFYKSGACFAVWRSRLARPVDASMRSRAVSLRTAASSKASSKGRGLIEGASAQASSSTLTARPSRRCCLTTR